MIAVSPINISLMRMPLSSRSLKHAVGPRLPIVRKGEGNKKDKSGGKKGDRARDTTPGRGKSKSPGKSKPDKPTSGMCMDFAIMGKCGR